jgi:hypothetical protein
MRACTRFVRSVVLYSGIQVIILSDPFTLSRAALEHAIDPG